jgi:hypothetical protein
VSDDLVRFAESIDREYRRLGHTLGWRFLYSPARTLAPSTRLAFVAANPGDSVYHPPMRSSEGGNSYYLDRWWGTHQEGVFQGQVRKLYEALAAAVPATTAKQLLDETLTLNFCPFRSPKWAQLPRKAESIAFSQRMWCEILDIVEPPAIVCCSLVAFENLEVVLRKRGAMLRRRESRPTGWGTYTWTEAHYATKRGKDVTMVGFPHLTQFPIFGRAKSRLATDEIVATISAAVSPQHTDG